MVSLVQIVINIQKQEKSSFSIYVPFKLWHFYLNLDQEDNLCSSHKTIK